MSLTIKTNCGDGEQEITFEDDGTLYMPDYDPLYEEAMVEFTRGQYKLSLCHHLYKNWDRISDRIMDRLVEETRKPYYDTYRDRYGFITDRQIRPFNQGDLACVLAEILKGLVKSENDDAIPIAGVIAGLNLKLNECPDIIVEYKDSSGNESDGVMRADLHTLKICDVEIAEWDRVSERRIYDIINFGSDVQDLSGEIEDSEPSEFVKEVLKALGIEDPDPEGPPEFDTPKPDETGNGAFGVMYEKLIWDSKKRPHEREVESVEVVIYDDESIAKEAAKLSERLNRNFGDDEYRVTLVRRMSPSELEEQRIAAAHREMIRKQYRLFNGGLEEIQELDPIYSKWTELEEDEDDRPEDFEG
jgi:hypothetical protein